MAVPVVLARPQKRQRLTKHHLRLPAPRAATAARAARAAATSICSAASLPGGEVWGPLGDESNCWHYEV